MTVPEQEPDGKTPGRRGAGRTALLIALGIGIALLAAGSFLFYSSERSVVVIHVDGVLHTGTSGAGLAGSEDLGRELRNAARDPLVEAIVLRVNSPGGTPSAAQEIIADIEYAKSRKPVVVSMGDMATSAAYQISAHADRIYATPDTLTGSIGTVWIFYDISELLEEEGIAVDAVKSGSRKDMGAVYRTLAPDEREYAQSLVDESCEDFINDIVEQRNVSPEAIEDGRIIRGEEALAIGLVDEMGNLYDAIEGARALAASGQTIR